jgi:hypothetical protein
MLNDKGLGRLSRRLLVVLCTLLLAGSIFMVLGVTVWAQQQPTQTTQAQSNQAGTVDFWEPAIGTRTVYNCTDFNDVHGQVWGPTWLGYLDIDTLYDDPLWPEPRQLRSSQYYHTTGISNLNPVYFDLAGPWYFRMTVPFKYIEEVKGINEAPDAAKFPQATYAIKSILIASGGQRVWGWEYRSNDPDAKKWISWGGSAEFFPTGQERMKKTIFHYSPSLTLVTFPLTLGTTGSIESAVLISDYGKVEMASGTYNVVAGGKITLASGTYDSLMIKYDWNNPYPTRHTEIGYAWIVQGTGIVTDFTSLPNEISPTFKTATDIEVMESQAQPAPSK